ncbi:unnamed protein product [Protopolystoma xenopodis]|uniref:Uncharacterized protein n=1 Tax=Protopolystoma xenopodis TaxID=117903 RepID=A0A3S4ZZG6_9PLAT|nr:unnamed protein product [Protopolystoma xenopodis]
MTTLPNLAPSLLDLHQYSLELELLSELLPFPEVVGQFLAYLELSLFTALPAPAYIRHVVELYHAQACPPVSSAPWTPAATRSETDSRPSQLPASTTTCLGANNTASASAPPRALSPTAVELAGLDRPSARFCLSPEASSAVVLPTGCLDSSRYDHRMDEDSARSVKPTGASAGLCSTCPTVSSGTSRPGDPEGVPTAGESDASLGRLSSSTVSPAPKRPVDGHSVATNWPPYEGSVSRAILSTAHGSPHYYHPRQYRRASAQLPKFRYAAASAGASAGASVSAAVATAISLVPTAGDSSQVGASTRLYNKAWSSLAAACAGSLVNSSQTTGMAAGVTVKDLVVRLREASQ